MGMNRRHGWSSRLLAGTMITALVFPGPAQAWTQARESERAAEARLKRQLQSVAVERDEASNASTDEEAGAPPRVQGAASASEILPVPLQPKRVQWISGAVDHVEPWTLFDGRSTTAWKLDSSEPVRIGVDLQEARSLAAITILGPTEGVLSAYALEGRSLRALAGLESVRIQAGTNEWRRLPIEDLTLVSHLVLEWTPSSASGPSEIGLWGRWLPPRDATDLELADRILASAAPGVLVSKATPERVTSSRVSLGPGATTQAHDGVVHVPLSADPRAWSRAFLVYELTGLGHFTQAVRQINGHPAQGGVSRPSSDGPTVEGGLQVEEISPDWLRLGDNEIRFLSLLDAGAPDYSVQRVRIVGTGHAGLAEARMTDAKVSETYSTQHFGFEGASKPHDLVFELVRPSDGYLRVGAAGPTGAAGQVKAAGKVGTSGSVGAAGIAAAKRRDTPVRVNLRGLAKGWHHVDLDVLPPTTGVDVQIDKASGGGRVRAEGLIPAVSEVLVTASTVPSSAESGRIGISYPLHGECRNHRALVTGFVTAERDDEIVKFSVNGQDLKPSVRLDRSFALELPEPPEKQSKPWAATLETTLSSGKTLRRIVKLAPCVSDLEIADKNAAEDEGAPYAQLVRAGERKTIEFAGAKLEIPAGAVDHDVRITMRPLVADQVRAMSPRVTNVSPEHRAYRLGPHGLKFKKPVMITLPYDPAALGQGVSEREVFTFYYDEALGTWQRIGRYDTAQAGVLTSLTEHFTDFISGVLAMPDEPGLRSFNANEMKGIKVADPAAGVDLLAPPEPNSSGAMNLRYPIELPPGRNGIQPALAFTYSSAKANGWMGVGWDLQLSAVEIDTRFGVPRYDESNPADRDHYVIDGEQIVETATGSNTYVRRVEGTFDTIVRNLNASTCVTSWTVTDKHGTVYTYGGAGAVLMQPGTPTSCNAFRWGLSSVQDTFGNRMEVTYFPDPQGGVGADPFVELYPKQVDYTSHVTTGSARDLDAAYRVLFVLDSGTARKDVIISGRPGFQERTRYRLDHVDVLLLKGSTLPTIIRRYQLAYQSDSPTHFYKTLLSSIAQQGLGAVTQLDQHTFEYGAAETVAINGATTGIRGFGDQQKWGTGDSGTALSRVEDEMGGGSGTIGIGLPIISVTVSGGGNGGGETTTLGLLDLNGDGLQDLTSGSGVYMNLLASPAPNHLQWRAVSNLSRLGSTSKSGWNASGAIGAFGIGANVGYTSTSTDDDEIMIDVDGDGWVDRAWVSGGQFQWLKNNGNNGFIAPPSPTNPTTVSLNTQDPNAQYLDAAHQSGGLSRINPLVRWKAPFAGSVTIQSAIQKLVAGGNGVDVAIYKNGSMLWSHTVAASDVSACIPDGTNACNPVGTGLTTTVGVGDSLYFMTSPHHDPSGPATQLGLESMANQVSWNPVITYGGGSGSSLKEPYGLPVYSFSQANDYRLYRPEVRWSATANGKVHVQQNSPLDPQLSRDTISDDVTLRIIKHFFNGSADSTFATVNIPGGSTTSGLPAVNFDVEIPVNKGDSISVIAESRTPVALERLGLNPRVTYSEYWRNVSTSDTPFHGPVTCSRPNPSAPIACAITGDPEPQNPVPPEVLTQPTQVYYPFTQLLGGPTQAYTAPAAQTLSVSGSLSLSNLKASAYVLLQGVNRLYSQVTATPDSGGNATVSLGTSVAAQAGDELLVTVYSEQYMTNPGSPISVSGSVSAGGATVPINVMYRDPAFDAKYADQTPVDPMSGGFHRWAAGFYNGDLGGFVPANIVFPLDAAGNPRNNPTKFFFGVPQRDGKWAGPGGAFISAGTFNASRGNTSSGGGSGLGSLRHAGTWNFELGGQVGPIALSANQGTTTNDHDFFDVNGDRYPDAVSADGTVQYGDGGGGFKWTQNVAGVSDLNGLRRVNHGSFRGGLSLGDNHLITDTGTDGSVRKTISTGFNIGTDYGLSSTEVDWVDMNGDGLPDAVIRAPEDGTPGRSHPFSVRLNYGYRLGAAVTWPANAWSTSSQGSATGVLGALGAKTNIDASAIPELLNKIGASIGINGVRLQDTGSNNVNVGAGFDISGISLGGGGGFSFGVTRTLVDMVDVNGDGLPDQVIRVADEHTSADPDLKFLRVRLNLGDRFDTSDLYLTVPKWGSIDPSTDFAFSGDINNSLGFRRSKSFTASVEVKVCIFICFGGSAFYENGSGWSHANFEDIDGDGRPDMVFKSTENGDVYAKINRLPKELNLLTKVNRPLAGSFEVQYQRAGNLVRRDLSPPIDEPSNKYVMSKVDVSDGRGNHYVKTFDYEATGYYARDEREDYGFKKVTTSRLQAGTAPYSSTEVNYENQSFYKKGLVLGTVSRDAASGNVFNVQTFTYASSTATGCTIVPRSVFPAELTRTTGYFEGSSTSPSGTPPVATSETRTWDCVGNLKTMTDAGDKSANNDITYTMEYNDPALLAAKIYKASRVTAKDHYKQTLRDRKATYNARGALLTLNDVVIGGVDPLTGIPNTGDPATNPTWTYGYDAFGNVNKVVDPRGYTLNYQYDTTTQTHRTQVLDSFNYASTSVPDLAFGVVASETDVNGAIVNYGYDEFGRLASVDGPYDVGTPNHTISFSYSEAGVPVSSGTPAANPSPAYAVTSHRDEQHPSQPIVTSTFADGLDRIIQTKKSLAKDTGSGVQVGMTVSGTVVYDDQGRVATRDQPYFDTSAPTALASPPTSPPPNRAVEIKYDVLDRAIETKTPLSAVTQATATTTYGISSLNGTSRLTTMVADANVSAGPPLPGYQRMEYRGVRGNVLRVVDKNRLGGGSTASTLNTSYGYNALNELLSVTDANGNATRATYDTLGRIVTLISPDAGRTDFQFDLSGNLAAKQTANLVQGCQFIRYQYEYNRLKKIDYPNSPDVTYEYGSDTEAGPMGLFRAARIKQETSEAGVKSYEYDPLGNAIQETWTLNRIGSPSDTVTRTLAYEYDSFGRLLTIYYPGASAETVNYGYDAGGNLDTVTGVTRSGTTTQYVQHIGYDEFEQRALIKVGNGITTAYAYDPFTRRLAGINASELDPALVAAGSPARPFQQVTYQYDPVGNVTQIANAAPVDPSQTGTVKVGPVTENFTYDDLYQLKTADGLHQTSATSQYHYGLSMSYDAISNIAQKTQQSETQVLAGGSVTSTTTRTDQTYTSAYTYAAGKPHAPSEVADTLPGVTTPAKRAFSYDKDGNQSSWRRTTGASSTRDVTYSDDNRVVNVTQDGTLLQEALYDAAGQRLVKRASGSAETAYFGQYLTVRDSMPTTKHVYAGDTRVASKFVPNDANEDCATCSDRASVTYFHGDQLGSTTFATDERQNLVAREQYFPSGELWVDETSDSTHARQPYLFNGKELDVETGLYYFGARYYDPRIGIWTSPDPILMGYMQGGPNAGVFLSKNLGLYSYSWNNPVLLRDPNGLAVGDPWYVRGLKMAEGVAYGTLETLVPGGFMVPKPGGGRLDSDVLTGMAAGEFATGSVEMLVGGGMVAGSGVGEIASVGVATPIAVPVAVAGAAIATNGVLSASKSGQTLMMAKNAAAEERAAASASPTPEPAKSSGRTGGQQRLKEIADDPNTSSADRGWIRQEQNSIERGQRETIRNPPGKQLAHTRGREAAKGYDHMESPSNLQDKDLHKTQHKFDDFGRKNKERPNR